jgi:nicotinate-nucleotide adenylyltransferase
VTRARPAAGSGSRRPVEVRSVGVLGGTFDPIHRGHLALAECALDQLAIDEIVLIPAGSPPHKQGRAISPADDRLAMVRLAVDGRPGISVDPIELRRHGPSYTVDTVAALLEAAERDGRPIAPTVIMSADAFAELPTWHEPDRLLRLARIAAAPRRGHLVPDPEPVIARLPGLAGRLDLFDGPDLDVSSSDIRARVRAGRPIDHLVPQPVAAYIEAHHLYRDPPWRKTRT